MAPKRLDNLTKPLVVSGRTYSSFCDGLGLLCFCRNVLLESVGRLYGRLCRPRVRRLVPRVLCAQDSAYGRPAPVWKSALVSVATLVLV